MSTVMTTPLNPLQNAYLLARTGMLPLSGVAMHDFREFSGHFDADQLEQSIYRLVQKYAALRTTIDENQLVQEVSSQVRFNFNRIDLSDLSHQTAMLKLDELREQFSHQIHPLDCPPWSICLVKLPPDDSETTASSMVFTSFDGLILDGFSISQILEELFLFNPGETDHKADKPTTQKKHTTSYFESKEADKQFWLNKLSRITSIPKLSWQQDLEAISGSRYQRQSLMIPQAEWQRLSSLGAKHRLLPNSLLTTVLLETLSQWSEAKRLLISLPISHSSILQERGTHSSFIVIEYCYDANLSFTSMAENVQKDILAAMAHASFSGVEIGKELIRKTSQPIPLPIALTNGLTWGKQLASEHMEYRSGLTQTPQLALDMRLTLSANADLMIDFDYAEQALSAGLIGDILNTLEQRFSELAMRKDLSTALPIQPISSPSLESFIPETEITDEIYPPINDYLSFIQSNLFTQVPDKTAIIYGEQFISYAELGKNVSALMQHFRKLKLQPGNIIAICLPKGPEHIYSALACSLCGIIWVPIDMASPSTRIAYLLNNCRADVAIHFSPCEALENLAIKSIDITAVLSDGLSSDSLSSDALLNEGILSDSQISKPSCHFTNDAAPAYYLYTSGSTGNPKCVVLNNLSTANVLQYTIERWEINANDVLIAATPFHHDLSVFEIYAALSSAATLVVPTPDEVKSAVAWADLVATHQVTVWSSVPAIVDMLLTCAQTGQLNSLRLINQGGDYLKPSVVKKLREILPNTRLFSIGGPTETTIWSIWHEITDADLDLIPYGLAFNNNEYFILDDHDQLCPVNSIGTIVTAGINLANGYLQDGELIQKDFIQVTTASGQVKRAFKTSDKGYFREDGIIMFAGRKEGYLKVRGVRISAVEIERALSQHNSINDCVVFSCVNPLYEDHELIAAYTSTSKTELAPPEIRRFLKTELPVSHIPSRWFYMDKFPLSRNGKIDRKTIKALAEKKIYQNYQAYLNQPESN